MDNTALVQRLYGFLNDYNLIQADLGEEEIQKILEATINKNLESEEEILTCFVASANGESDNVYVITDKSRILANNTSEEISIIDISEIKSIENGENEESSHLFLSTDNDKHALHAFDEEGVLNINDALYSAMNELLPIETVAEIFNEELEEEPTEEEDVETVNPEEVETVEENITEEIPTAEPTLEKEYTNPELPEATLTTENLPKEEELSETNEENNDGFQDNQFAADSDFNTENFPSEASTATIPGKKYNINKPLLYILGAIAVAVIAYIIYSATSSFIETRNANTTADTLIDYFNQVDDIYTTASDYSKNPNGVNTDQWKELDTKARDLETKISETDSNDKTRNLSDAVYYYDEALITALIYGQNFAASKNPYDQNSLTKNLKQANLNRSAALGFINEDFPKLADKVKNNEDDAEVTLPNQEKIDKLIEEAESHPSEGAENRENSGDSK